MNLDDADDFRRLFGNRAAAFAGDQQMHFAELCRRSHRRQRRVLYGRLVMFNPDERLHAATPRSLSFATSASTSATLMPASRFGGFSTLSFVRRGELSNIG